MDCHPGAITGTRTTGCTYSGQLSVRPEQKAVVMAAVTKTCAGAATQLRGVAAKTEDKLGITVLLTNGDESAAVTISLVKRGVRLALWVLPCAQRLAGPDWWLKVKAPQSSS